MIETWLAARQGTAALAGWAVMLPFALLLQQMSAGAMLLRIAIAVGGGWWLASGASLGMDGQFLAVALGITAYGVVTALGARPGVWGPKGAANA